MDFSPLDCIFVLVWENVGNLHPAILIFSIYAVYNFHFARSSFPPYFQFHRSSHFPHLGPLFLKSFRLNGCRIDFHSYFITLKLSLFAVPCSYELLDKSSFVKFTFFILLVYLPGFPRWKISHQKKCLTSCKIKLVSKRSGKLVFQRGSCSQCIGYGRGTRYLCSALFDFVFILIVMYRSVYPCALIASSRNWPLRDEFSVFSRFLRWTPASSLNRVS